MKKTLINIVVVPYLRGIDTNEAIEVGMFESTGGIWRYANINKIPVETRKIPMFLLKQLIKNFFIIFTVRIDFKFELFLSI